jgi:hypothetical protein
VDGFFLKSGASSSSILLASEDESQANDRGEGHGPALFLVQLVAHAFGESSELSFGFGVVSVNHECL